MKTKFLKTSDYLLLIDEETEIEADDKIIYKNLFNLIGIAGEDNLSLEHFSKIIAYYPLTKEAKELDLPLLPNPFKEEIDIEKLACNIYNLSLDEYEYIKEDLSQNRELIEEHYKDMGREEIAKRYFDVISFIAGNAAQAKRYSLEDMKKAFGYYAFTSISNQPYNGIEIEREFNQFIQSLSTQQLPKEFVPEYEPNHRYINSTCLECGQVDNHDEIEDELCTGCHKDVSWKHNYEEIETKLKSTTNSEGKQELVGTYKY